MAFVVRWPSVEVQLYLNYFVLNGNAVHPHIKLYVIISHFSLVPQFPVSCSSLTSILIICMKMEATQTAASLCVAAVMMVCVFPFFQISLTKFQAISLEHFIKFILVL